MRRFACVLTLAALCLWLPAAQSQAGNGWHGGGGGWHGGGGHGGGWHGGGWLGGTRVVVGFGPGWGWGPGWGYGPGWGWGGWGYGYGPGWYPPAYAYPPVVIQQQPQQYIEQPNPQPGGGYWYYCESAGGYYPRVPSCPEPWLKVPPAPQ